MGMIGLVYAVSQGAVAKPLVARFKSDPRLLLLACVSALGGLRPIALWTPSVAVVYVCYAPMVVALGVMNTAITASSARLALSDELGGFFGVLESVESVAGLLGPTLGGLLARTHEHAALGAVVTCYALVFALVALFYNAHVARATKPRPSESSSSSSSELPHLQLDRPAPPPRRRSSSRGNLRAAHTNGVKRD